MTGTGKQFSRRQGGVDIKRKLGKLSGFNVRNTECLHSP